MLGNELYLNNIVIDHGLPSDLYSLVLYFSVLQSLLLETQKEKFIKTQCQLTFQLYKESVSGEEWKLFI